MTYAEAKIEAEKRNETRKAWEADNIGKVESVHQFDRVAAYNKLEGAPPNMNFPKHQDHLGFQVVVYSDGVNLVPSNILTASKEMIQSSCPTLPLSILDENCWTVKSWLDDLDW